MEGPGRPVHDDSPSHVRREAATMGLYVAVCLLAVLATRKGDAATTVEGLAIVWGATLGLALAHWFAFQLSGRLVGRGEFTRADGRVAAAQLAGAAGVAAVVSIPILVLPGDIELDAARLVASTLIALVGYLVASSAGASRLRALIYAAAACGLATAVALAKNLLAAH